MAEPARAAPCGGGAVLEGRGRVAGLQLRSNASDKSREFGAWPRKSRIRSRVLRAPSPPPNSGRDACRRRTGMLGGRENRLAELASGKSVTRVQELVDPARCRIWEGHNRDYAALNAENLRRPDRELQGGGTTEFPSHCAAGRGGSRPQFRGYLRRSAPLDGMLDAGPSPGRNSSS